MKKAKIRLKDSRGNYITCRKNIKNILLDNLWVDAYIIEAYSGLQWFQVVLEGENLNKGWLLTKEICKLQGYVII